MAATAAYVDVVTIPAGGKPGDSHRESNIGATSSAFSLLGGLYGVTCKASTYGTVTLQVMAADATTWLVALTAFSADGSASVNLPPGSYRVALG